MSFKDLLSSKGRVLVYLAERGGVAESVELSTVKLGRDLGISQQSASRLLIELESDGLIEREDLGRVRRVRLTRKSVELVGRDDLLKRMILERAADIVIEGFSDGVRAYGGARCIRGRLNGEEVVVIFIERTHYSKDVIEVIAPVCLREKLGLSDGDKAILRVRLTPTDLMRSRSP